MGVIRTLQKAPILEDQPEQKRDAAITRLPQ